MFKLIKILGGRTNVPEIISLRAEEYTEYRANCVYYLAEGIVNTTCYSGSDPIFIPIENIAADDHKPYVRGYFVSEEMIFETNMAGELGEVGVGSFVAPNIDESEITVGVTSDAGYFAVIVSMDEVLDDGKVLIRFKW